MLLFQTTFMLTFFGSVHGYLFYVGRWYAIIPLSVARVLKAGQAKLGVPAGEFGTHSFRIGAVTAGPELDFPHDGVQGVGRC